MSISREMTKYITTGRCPQCDAQILDRKYVSKNSYKMNSVATGLAGWFNAAREAAAPNKSVLTPPGAAVRFHGGNKHLQCLTCLGTWPTGTTFEEDMKSLQSRRDRLLDARLPLPALRSYDEILTVRSLRPGRTQPSSQGREVDLAGCSVTEIRKIGQVEKRLSEERKRYPNNSKVATLTKEVSVSNTVTREIMIESSQLKAHNAEAGITFFGFAAIQGQVQQQLNQTYSVTTQNTITISETTTIQIPPQSIIEHVIQWKVISESGLAILGRRLPTASRLAEVPYEVPLRLTYTEEINDVPATEKSSG
jgi:hypothetical protein